MPRVAPEIALPPLAQVELERLARAPSTPQAVALRARLVLSASQGLSNQRIAADFRVTPNTVGKWRTRYALHGVDGLTDYQHPGRPPKHGPEVHKKLRRLLRQPPPSGAERWTVRGLAEQLGMPPSSVHDILVATGFESRRRPVRRRPRY
jgi:transposase